MIIYDKLWKKMQEQSVSQYRLHAEGISNSTLTRLRRNEPISTETIDKLCRILQCNVENIMEYKEDSNELS
jgi:DNA-binding Xre family transcriptional regulator